MALTIQDMQKVTLTAVGVSAAGNPTNDLTDVTWASSDPNIIATVNANGLTVDAEAQGPLGSVTVSCSGTNSSGAVVVGEIVIDVAAGPTAAILIEASPPVPR